MKKSKIILKRLCVIIIALSMISMFNFWLFIPKDSKNIDIPQKKNQENKIPFKTENSSDVLEELNSEQTILDLKNIEIKTEVNLLVPFESQAPFANWDDLHNEACEEASLIMVKHWLDEEELSSDKMEEEILKMVAFQEKKWGGHYDLDINHVIELAKDYYNIDLSILYNPNKENIKRELSIGNLIIAPMAGRLLKNRYYRSPGPVYHMLVVRGYNKKEVITNDPGTKRGKNFKYSWNNFLESIHNWPLNLGQKISKEIAAQEILKGVKMVIIVKK